MNYSMRMFGDDEKKESLLYRSLDIKPFSYQTEFEKQVSILPNGLA